MHQDSLIYARSLAVTESGVPAAGERKWNLSWRKSDSYGVVRWIGVCDIINDKLTEDSKTVKQLMDQDEVEDGTLASNEQHETYSEKRKLTYE